MSKLYSPLRIGQLELSHRLVTTMRTESSFDATAYRQRTTPGGLVVADGCPEREAEADRWACITNAVHEAGGLAVALVSPCAQGNRADEVAIDEIMDDVRRAARLAMAAGFDGAELDAADGSLADRFLAAETNSRSDDYGGDEEDRMRFMLEAAHVVAEECSSERVGVRLSPCAREGRSDLFAEVMRAVSEREFAYIHIAKYKTPLAVRLSLAAIAEQRAFRADVSCALVVSDECGVDEAAFAVDSRWADAVGFMQANEDPDLIARLLRGRTPSC
jgi:N-ethylmaleimide reductase